MAIFTNAMVYTMPMLAITTIIATSLSQNDKYNEIKRGRHFRAIARNPEMISDIFDFFEE
jgi:hypothetical protein